MQKVPRITKDGARVPEKPQTLIAFELKNPTDNIRISYRPWGLWPATDCTLVDNFGNDYPIQLGYRGDFIDYPEGQAEYVKLDPGTSVQDVLVFEDVLPQAQWVDLTVAGVGTSELTVLRIPATMILRK